MKEPIQHLPLMGLAGHLVQDGLLKLEVAAIAAQEARQQELSFVSYLVKNKLLNSEDIFNSCKKNLGLPSYDLKNYETILLKTPLLSFELIRHYRVIPLEKQHGVLHIGISDPTDQHTLDAITFHTGLRIFPIIISENQLDQFIEKYCNKNEKKLELSLLNQISLDEQPNVLQDNSVNYDEPLIKFVDQVIRHAIEQKASDIHIEPYSNNCRIRYRRDGILYEVTTIPIELASRFVTRLKVMAKLDISERRLPQDGRFHLDAIDIRINTCPTLFGEKIVLRLLDSNKFLLDLCALGFTNTQHNLFISNISKPHGMILVTGPTGCGKTVTLYSALNYLNVTEKNISTVEDPVEIQLTGINQVSIQPKIGLDFSTILRTLLRQDPDIIMLGEIRDKETAHIAIQAAHTGHLVLSTLHTNSAIESISRLMSMGIAAYNIVSSVSLIIAQRLVRILCSYCKQPETLSLKMLDLAENNSKHIIYRAVGCQQCLHGYSGRTGIYEFLPITEKISNLILSGADSITINNEIQQQGYNLLQQMGKEKILTGVTSIMEINRVLQT